MKKLTLGLLILAILGSAGCNRALLMQKDYASPISADSPKAKVSFYVDSSNPDGTTFEVREGDGCVVNFDFETMEKDSKEFYGRTHVSADRASNTNDLKSQIIPAEKQITVLMTSKKYNKIDYRTTQVRTCQFAMSWTPEDSKEYVVAYRWKHGGCRVAVAEKPRYGKPLPVEDAKIYQYNRQDCKPL